MTNKTYVVKLILGCTDMPDSPAGVLCARRARLNQASSGRIEKASGNDASLFEAEIAAPARSGRTDDDVVYQLDQHDSTRFENSPGEPYIGLRSRRVTRRVIMHQDERIG